MSDSSLRSALSDYLAVRRSLGFKLVRQGLLLGQFISFCEEAGAQRVTNEMAMAWITLPDRPSPSWLSMRLDAVRGFATWLQALDPATEVPERGWLPPVHRTTPYLYSQDDVLALLDQARRVRWPLSAATYETLIGLLAVTGMRIGEALRLDRTDVSLDDGRVVIVGSKLGKSRQVLLHPSTVDRLRRYLRQRAKLSPAPSDPALFVSPAGTRISYVAVQATFRAIARRAGIEPRSERCRPTVHALRHSFAVDQLTRWYREGVDVQANLPVLSTWLGHADPKWTYWYLSAVPELLSLAAARLEASERRP